MIFQLFNANFCSKLHVRNRSSRKFLNLELFCNYFALSACYHHVTCEFHNESTLYSLSECQETRCSNQVPYLEFIDSNTIRTHNHLVHKWTINHLAELATWLSVVVYKLSGCEFEPRCCHFALYLYEISGKGLEVAKNVKISKFEGSWSELQAKVVFVDTIAQNAY